MMKRQGILAAVATLACAAMLTSPQASAAPGPHLNVGHNLRASETSCPSGRKLLNIVYKITNSVDSGTGTNDSGAPWWATIDYVAQVQVVELGPNEFCATVKDQGSFETVGGDGPGCANDASCGQPEDQVEAGVIGTVHGGDTENFTGTFTPGGNRTKGSIGTFDHNCDPSTPGGDCDGAGVTRWLGLYFTGATDFNFDEWWGWVYHAGNNGTWVNAIDGNDGNITGD
jgi:hypothetical protein